MNHRHILAYVASPLSRGDLTENVRRANAAGIALLKAGLSVIVPHGSAFMGNRTGNIFVTDADGLTTLKPGGFYPEATPAGTTHEDWLGCDEEIVRRCDCVLRLSGESVGADRETAVARECGIPVFGDIAELLEWAGVND